MLKRKLFKSVQIRKKFYNQCFISSNEDEILNSNSEFYDSSDGNSCSDESNIEKLTSSSDCGNSSYSELSSEKNELENTPIL